MSAMQITYSAISSDQVRAYQGGGRDANGQIPERQISDGQGNPCRHCLDLIPEGAEMLVLAHRPFEGLHAYAETGPIFLCARPCARYETKPDMPPVLSAGSEFLLKGYGRDDRIVYGTGAVISSDKMQSYADAVFNDPKVAYIHVRSARNNCYQARIDRG
jgi:hypothetical protein